MTAFERLAYLLTLGALAIGLWALGSHNAALEEQLGAAERSGAVTASTSAGAQR